MIEALAAPSHIAKPLKEKLNAERLWENIFMQDKDDPSLAHPSAWAPFVIVGEGGY